MNRGPIASVISIALAGVFASAVGAADPVAACPPSAPDDHVVVQVSGLRNDHGAVHCVLYDSADHFPEGRDHRIANADGRPAGGVAQCTFDHVPRGRNLAVAIHHDENNDHVFQRGMFGLPQEGYGFSNNARPVFSAPSFAACRFQHAGGTSRLSIVARY